MFMEFKYFQTMRWKFTFVIVRSITKNLNLYTETAHRCHRYKAKYILPFLLIFDGPYKVFFNQHFQAGFNFVYGFAYYSALESKVFGNAGSATLLQDVNTSEYASALPGSQVMRYITNHDVYSSDGSPITIYGGKTGSMAAFLVTAYMKGVPMIYNGQEVGCTRDLNIFYHNPID